MTVSTTIRSAGPFIGNGVTTAFPFNFTVFEADDILAVSNLAGVETILTLTTDYTVTLNPDQDNTPGGTVTLNAPLAVGRKLALTTAIAALQDVAVTNNGGFFAEVFNRVFDKLTVLIQQCLERQDRALTVGVTETGVMLQVPVSPNQVLQWSPDGSQLISRDLADLGLVASLPSQGGQGGKVLGTNGTSISWTALIPVQTGQAGKVLSTDGNTTSWVAQLAAATAAELLAGVLTTKAITPDAAADSREPAAQTTGGTVALSLANTVVHHLTLNSNLTLNALTNIGRAGQPFVIRTIQDGSGSRLLSAINSGFKFPGGTVPVFSTAAGAVDEISGYVVQVSPFIASCRFSKDIK